MTTKKCMQDWFCIHFFVVIRYDGLRMIVNTTNRLISPCYNRLQCNMEEKMKENQTKSFKFKYVISDQCNTCGACKVVCPTHCISKGSPYVINEKLCIRCGKCVQRCWRKFITKV